MDKQTLDKLEFSRIRESLSQKCYSPPGLAFSEALYPLTDHDKISAELDETAQMTEILRFEEPFPLETVDPVDDYLYRLKIDNTYLDPSEYRKIAHFINVCDRIKRYFRNKSEKYTLITSYIKEIASAPEICQKVEKAIDRDGEIKDSASSKLRKIRIDKQVVRNRILDRLESMLSNRRSSGDRQDDLVTIRDGRYVIPVSSSDFTSKSGVVHGRSKSGATFFVEPMQTVEMNNQLRGLYLEEEAEIERILIDIGDSIRERSDELKANYQIIGRIDFLHAKARLAVQLDCNKPELAHKALLELNQARHPLLIMAHEDKHKVVPLDLSLGVDFNCLVITGPNMGGKTVALKTAGLLALMAQSGLLIPAGENCKVGIFDHVFADIGDEQSIELSLSTFSAHISRIISAIKECRQSSLILIDELGAGTDPVEGSALGEAILNEILRCRGKAVVTTHYSALKTLPEKDRRIQNASLEFNQKTLEPTYRLKIGLPGSSYAIEMAKRLGMPEKVVAEAVKLVGSQERNLAELISKLQSATQKAEFERKVMNEQKAAIDEAKTFYENKKAEIEKSEKEHKKNAEKEARVLVEKTRADLERLIKEIKESQASKKSVKKSHEYIDRKREELREKTTDFKAKPEQSLSPGDRVLVENLQAEGELLDKNANTGIWRVQVGNLVVNTSDGLLKKLKSKEKAPKPPAGVNYAPFSDISMQISLRGMTSDEAVSALEKYLDSVALANLEKVYILHGKGTGALRKAVHDYLKTHPAIEDYRLGYFDEGGSGVTVVSMKQV
ncbi:MAG: endonuclease MutS2 [candidate division Zixibacteria bacterium]|nr:endonuclease MutS2 [candidate division Zixibacteria bacterium]